MKRRRQPIVDREIDFSRAIEYSPPINKEKYQIQISKSFIEVPPKNYPMLFVKKCEECSHILDFQNSYLCQKQIDIKSTLLRHLISGFENSYLCQSIGSQHFNSFLNMIRKNIFRAFPKLMLQESDVNDLSWPHLKLVYRCLKKSLFFNYYNHISINFLYNLLRNIASYDKRERAYVCSIAIDLYSKHDSLNLSVCKCISSLLSINICSNELFQLIYLISTKINSSFDTNFFIEYILPIHLLEKSMTYQYLIECDLTFTIKDPNLFPYILQYILNHWPITNLKKCPFFLKIIVRLFELFFNDNNGRKKSIVTIEMVTAFFDVVSLCAHSEYAEAASYALHLITLPMIESIYHFFIINNNTEYDCEESYIEESFDRSFLKLNQSVILAENHWDDSVRSRALDAKLALSRLDPIKFKEVRRGWLNNTSSANIYRNEIDEKWNIIIKQARRRYKSIRFNDL